MNTKQLAKFAGHFIGQALKQQIDKQQKELKQKEETQNEHRIVKVRASELNTLLDLNKYLIEAARDGVSYEETVQHYNEQIQFIKITREF